MLILLLGCAMPASDSGGATSSEPPPPGDALTFHEVAYGEVGGPDALEGVEPCATALVSPAGSEPDLAALLDAQLPGSKVPAGVDWTVDTALVAYIEYCTHGGQALEMTGVWDLGGGALQVDLTFHEGQYGTAMMSRAYTIATVPAGTYTATAVLTIDSSDTGLGER